MPGFFFQAQQKEKTTKTKRSEINDAALISLGCQACPLNAAEKELEHPKMPPSGAADPYVLIMGEAPGGTEDQKGEQFVGRAGQLLRPLIPSEWRQAVMFDNTIRCRPPVNRTPTINEILCCSKHTRKNVADSKPFAILGLGATALNWAVGESNITAWRGRFIPICIDGHDCWFFSTYHPAYILRLDKGYGFKTPSQLTFENDIKTFFSTLDSEFPPAKVYKPPYTTGITINLGRNEADFQLIQNALAVFEENLEDVGIDLETTGLRPYNSQILSVAIGTFDNTIAFPLEHPSGWRDKSLRTKVIEFFLAWVLRFKGRLIVQNAFFELEHLSYRTNFDMLRIPQWEDTMLQGKALDERNKMHNLATLTKLRLGFNVKQQSKVNPVKWKDYSLDELLLYNGMDSKWEVELFHTQESILKFIPNLENEYQRLRRTVPTLVSTSLAGLCTDEQAAIELRDSFSRTQGRIYANILETKEVKQYISTIGPFNPGSPDQVFKLLTKVLGLNVDSSDESVLEKVEGYASPKQIKEYREVSKLLSTYILPIINKDIVYSDGMLHPIYHQTMTRTGRLSAEGPNIQNWPKRVYRQIRKIIKAALGCSLVSIDFGQIEARVMACASEDKNFCESLWKNEDVHAIWSRRIIELYPQILNHIALTYSLDESSPDFEKKQFDKLRDEIKNKFVFALFYGAVAKTTAERLDVPLHIAEQLVKEFWDVYSGVKRWHQKIITKYERFGYVETLSGSRRSGALSVNELINTCSQGTAAHIVVDGMNKVSEFAYYSNKPEFQPHINIHDDLSFYFPDEQLDDCIFSTAEMLCCSDLPYIIVPLEVEVALGRDWYGQEKISKFSTIDFDPNAKERLYPTR